MENQIQKKSETEMSLTSMHQMATMLLKSGFLPQAIRTPEQALAVMITGKELNLGFMESLRSINIIQGKPCMSAQLLLGLCYRTKEVELASSEVETDQEHVFVLKRKGSPAYKSKFTAKDAENMGLLGKDNWKKQRATMLKWRAISAACRVVFPDAISGVYTPEEINPDLVIETKNGHETVVEPIKEVAQTATAKTKEKELGSDDIPEDQLGNYVMKAGKFAGLRLTEIMGKQTETGKATGIEYLEWCAENLKNEQLRNTIKRFVEVMSREQVIEINE